MQSELARDGRLMLRLYIAGHAPNSLRAITNVRAVCEEHFAAGHEIEIVDMLEHPQRALDDRIVVTPTLLKVAPLPTVRMIGTLNDPGQLALALGRS